MAVLFSKTLTHGTSENEKSPDCVEGLAGGNNQDQRNKAVKKMTESRSVTIIYCVVLLTAAIAWFILAAQSHAVVEDRTGIKDLSYSYFNVFGILIFFLYVLPLHRYIPKIKNSDGGSTLISDILTQIVISPFSLEILRKLPSFVFFTTKSC